MLHAILTASFLVLPLVLRDEAGVASGDHWEVYLPVMFTSVLVMLPFIFLAERSGRIKPVFLGAIIVLMCAELGLYLMPPTLLNVIVLLIIMFAAFNLLEAMLPSLVSRVAPVDCRGTAMGFYSSSQFLGAFLGGSLGGLLQGMLGLHGVFMCAALGALIWVLVAATMSSPLKLSNYIYRTGTLDPGQVSALSRQLSALAGVAEAVVVAEEGVAYLKVDKRVFDEAALP